MKFDSIFFQIDGKSILDGIFLELIPGKLCGLFGENGSGKSSLIKIVAGINAADSGNIFINDKILLNKSKNEIFKYIAYLSQDSFLPKDISILELIKSYGIIDNKEYILDNLSSNLVDQKIGELSGGELRLLEVLLILSLNRPYILIDEPFTGIEPKIIEKMIDLISKERDNGKGILITDHYHQYISEIVDYAYLLKDTKCYFIPDNKEIVNTLKEHNYIK